MGTSDDDFAARFVTLYAAGPGGCYGVRLSAPGIDPVVIGRTANPAVAREWVVAARRFVAAVREQKVTDALTEPPESPTGGNGGRLVELPG
ncbi:MAG TPA: hypothetical protein VFG68_07280 [Fimbriiglobus sp.]|nr:hypothetical protein [Fimbriiglobus sp.]